MDESSALEDAEKLVELVTLWETQSDSPREANKTFGKMHELEKRLRATSEGRDALRNMMSDSRESVRLIAGVNMLLIDPVPAEEVLRVIEAESTSLFAVDAKYTLREFHRGKLNLDW